MAKDGKEQSGAESTTPVDTSGEKAKVPPWGDDANFDPETAWNLIQRLREQKNDPTVQAELRELRTQVATLTTRAETAEKSLQDRDTEDSARKLRADIAKDKGIPDSDVLTGTTKEEIEAHADRLVNAFKVEKPKAPPADGQGESGTPVDDGKEMSADDVVKAALAR